MTTKTSFWKTNIGKTIIAGAYVAGSAIAGFLISETTSNPELFGPYTVLINMVAVLIAKTLSDKTPNLGQ